jgi:predicted nucleic acid-binding Zn ribbon protein
MPTYVYRFVDSDETIEVHQSFHEDALTEAVHPVSGDLHPVKKVFTPVGITFKGKGFYKTDSRGSSSSSSSGSSSAASSSNGSSSGESSSSSSSSDSAPASSTASETKSETKTKSTTHSHGGSTHSH